MGHTSGASAGADTLGDEPLPATTSVNWGDTVSIDRRSFLKAGLAGAGVAALGGSGAARASGLVNLTGPAPSLLGGPTPRSNINHVVVVMMENRSTDHFLGWWGDRADVRFDASTTHPTRPTFDFGIHGEQNWTGQP